MSKLTITSDDGISYFLCAEDSREYVKYEIPQFVIPWLHRNEVFLPVWERIQGMPTNPATLHEIRDMLVNAAMAAGATPGTDNYGILNMSLGHRHRHKSTATDSIIHQLGAEDA